MMLLFKIAFRELINARRFSLIFIINLSLGLLGFVLIYSFKSSVNLSLEQRAKQLLGSDLTITGRRSMTEEEANQVETFLSPYVEQAVSTLDIYSMAKNLQIEGRSRLVLVKMIEAPYPLYGELAIEGEGDVDSLLLKSIEQEPRTWISPEVAHQMKLKVNDKLKIGEQNFTVQGIIGKDSSSSWQGAALAPKLYISKKFQEATKLISFGTVATYSRLYTFKVQYQAKDEVEKIKKELNIILKDPALSVMLPDNSSEQVGRVLNYLTDYLGLVALVAIFLSGIGSSYLFQNYIFQKIHEVGILKSLGLTLGKLKKLYLIQLLMLGLVGVIIALLMANLVLPWTSLFLKSYLSIDVLLQVGIDAVLVSFFVGVVSIIIVCYPILSKLVSQRTIELFHAQSTMQWHWGKWDYIKYLPLVLVLELLAVWQAQSIKVGTIFTLTVLFMSLIVSIILPKFLSGINRWLMSKTTSLKTPFSLAFGMALRELVRSRLTTVLTFLSLSIGVMLLTLIGLLEVGLNQELISQSDERPSLFLFDIQMEQKEELEKYSQKNAIPLFAMTPMVRARIMKLNGQEHARVQEDGQFTTREEEQSNRMRNRGVNITYGGNKNDSFEIVNGRDFTGVYHGEGLVEISLEQRYAQRLGLKLGDTMTFEILGLEIEGKIISFRKIKWTNFVPNFFITLQPGVLEDAPQTYLAAIKQLSLDQQLVVQDLIVERFPNISMINVTEVIEKMLGIFKTMSVAVKIMAYLCILVGFFVIYAIIQNQLRKRNIDLAIQKSYGSRAIDIVKQFTIEYVILASAATSMGILISLILGNILSILFFDGRWSWNFSYLATIIVTILSGTMLLVVVSTWKTYRQRIMQLMS
jgi:putative ABC transport system permease protein